MIESQRGKYDFLVIAPFLVAVVFWQSQELSFVVYPFRLFVTMIHELGHGLSAVLTGGDFLRFEVTKRGAGLAITRGGTRSVVIQAGYLGTALFGGLLLFLANRAQKPGRVAIGVGFLIGLLTLMYSGLSFYRLSIVESFVAGGVLIAGLWLFLSRETDEGRYIGLAVTAVGSLILLGFAGSGNLLTIVVGLCSAIALVFMGLRADRRITVGTLTFLAFLTGLQAITDAWVLLKIVSLPSSLVPNNDASAMSREIGGSATIWALVWIGLDIVIFGTAIYLTFVRNNQTADAKRV
jgi:hypothetical protein